MRKFFTLIMAVVLAASTASAATTFSFTSAASVSQSADGYTVKIDKGAGNNAPAYYDNGLRLYAKNTITVSGSDITSIHITFAKQGTKDYASLTATPGTLVSGGVSTSQDNTVTDSWTGSANSVTFTLGDSGQRLISKLVINGDGSEGGDTPSQPGDPTEPDYPSILDPDFQYPEPTLVKTPGTTVQGEAYTFVGNNIEVSCTKGAVNADYFSAHAGFEMTFTAVRPIKGIVINGFVKKDFEATVDHGQVSYLSPANDTEGNPVVVITDINAQSVTISCVKQLRCYTVEVYFEANPDATVSGGSGETVDLTFDTAEAVYESEYSEMIGEDNYSIFLYNWDDYDPYFALDIYPATHGVLTGTYLWEDYTLGDYCYYVYGAGDDDMTWVDGGTVTISKTGDIYTIKGELLCDNGKTYSISFSGEMPIYTDDEYYGDESGVKEIVSVEESKADDTMYDVLGRKVGKNYRGIYIRGGKKYVGR